MTFNAVFGQGGKVRTELYIDFGNAEKNKKLFDRLNEQKEEIYHSFGSELEWEPMDEKRASRLTVYRNGSIDANEEELFQIKNWHIETLVRMKNTLNPFIKRKLNL